MAPQRHPRYKQPRIPAAACSLFPATGKLNCLLTLSEASWAVLFDFNDIKANVAWKWNWIHFLPVTNSAHWYVSRPRPNVLVVQRRELKCVQEAVGDAITGGHLTSVWLFKCFFKVQKIFPHIEKSKCDVLGDYSVIYLFFLHNCAINIAVVVLFSNTVYSASTLPFRPPPVWQGQPYFPRTSASLPPRLHRLCFLLLRGNFWSVIRRSLRPLPVAFPRGLRRCQSRARLQSAKYFAIDLTDARRRLSFFFLWRILTSEAGRFSGQWPFTPAHLWALRLYKNQKYFIALEKG